jgi:hypothetical protein
VLPPNDSSSIVRDFVPFGKVRGKLIESSAGLSTVYISERGLHGERILGSGMAFPLAILEFIYRKCDTLRQLLLCKGGEVLNILLKLRHGGFSRICLCGWSQLKGLRCGHTFYSNEKSKNLL